MPNDTKRDAGRAQSSVDASLRKRQAAFCAMGDSFFLHSRDASLSTDARADYASDAVSMYEMGGMEDGHDGCVDVRLAQLIAFVAQCKAGKG